MPFVIHEAQAADKPADTGAATAAQTAADVKVPPELSPEKMMTDNLLILVFLFAIFYFILIRPQQLRVKQHKELVKGLQKGNKVITSGGLIGTIVKLEGDDVVVVEIAQGVKVRVARSSISEVMSKTPAAGENANDN